MRQLRNDTAAVVRRVEAGERLVLTVNRRPVADIAPHDPRPAWVPGAVVRAIAEQAPADRGLQADLERLAGQTVDEL